MLNNVAGLLGGGVPPELGAWESISTTTVGSATSYVDFTSIPTTYKHLQLRANVQMASTADMDLRMGNGSIDTGSNYSYHALYGSGSGSGAALNSGGAVNYGAYVGYFNSGGSSFAGVVIDILDYADTNKYKTTRTLEGNDSNGSGFVFLSSGLWMSTSAVNTLRFWSKDGVNIAAGSHFALYGIKG